MKLLGWLVVSICFLLVLFAEFLPLPFGGYDSQRFLLALMLVSILIYSVVWSVHCELNELLSRSWPGLLVATMFLALAAPYHGAPFNWVEPVEYALFFASFTLSGAMIGGGRSAVYWAGVIATVAAVFVFFYGALSVVIYVYALLDKVHDLSAYIPWGFANIRYWSHIATWLLPLLPLAVMIGPLKKQRLWQFLVALGAALWWWIVMLSAARGTAVGLALGVLSAALFFRHDAFPWLAIFLRYLFYGVLIWLLLSVLVPSIVLDDLRVSALRLGSSGRIKLFSEAWQMSLQAFPCGLGPQSWLTHEILTDAYRNAHKVGHPHNMYLMWAAEYGWLSIVGLFLLVMVGCTRLWQKRRNMLAEGRPQISLLSAFLGAVVAALVHAGVSAVFIAPGSMLVGLLVLSIFWALICPDGAPLLGVSASLLKTNLGVRVIALLLVLSISVFWIHQVWSYHQAMESDLEYRRDGARNSLMPRFWLDGNFPRREVVRPLVGQ